MPAQNPYRWWVNENFVNACHDYFYLLDRGFPERGVLKLVGDRYRLSGDERTVLYRGISSRKRSDLRKSLLVSDVSGQKLIIDGYNLLFTLLNYRLGKITFISTDNILRDAGSLHGKLRDEETLSDYIEMLLKHLQSRNPVYVEVHLDSPVSHSEKHAGLIRSKMKEYHVAGECYVLKSADWALKNSSGCILATSDTAIIEKALLPVTDLPAEILRETYNAGFVNISEFLFPDQAQNSVDES